MKKTKGELNLKEYLVISFAFGSLFKKGCNSNVDDHSTVSQFKTVEDCDKVFPPPPQDSLFKNEIKSFSSKVKKAKD